MTKSRKLMLLLGDYIGSHKSLPRDAIVTAWLLTTICRTWTYIRSHIITNTRSSWASWLSYGLRTVTCRTSWFEYLLQLCTFITTVHIRFVSSSQTTLAYEDSHDQANLVRIYRVRHEKLLMYTFFFFQFNFIPVVTKELWTVLWQKFKQNILL